MLQIHVEAPRQDQLGDSVLEHRALPVQVVLPEAVVQGDQDVPEVQENVRRQHHLLAKSDFPLAPTLRNLLPHHMHQHLELGPLDLARAVHVGLHDGLQEGKALVVALGAEIEVREDLQELFRGQRARVVLVVALEQLHELRALTLVRVRLLLVNELDELHEVTLTASCIHRLLDIQLVLAVHRLQPQVGQGVVDFGQVQATALVVVVALEDLLVARTVDVPQDEVHLDPRRKMQCGQPLEPVQALDLLGLELEVPQDCRCRLHNELHLLLRQRLSQRGHHHRPFCRRLRRP
mmetsp:Transcript_26435/g.87670  ORF Transcript_26435/g.87670 Transcript_26435/m.87670 type:complete len:292 (+) Transcript_26435:765-1640(+)